MRLIIGMVSATMALAAATPAMAEWVQVATDDRGALLYYDPATITRNGQYVKYRALFDSRNVEGDLDEPPLSNSLEEMDCKGNRMRPVEIIDYDEFGSEIERFQLGGEDHWFDIAAGSVAAQKRTQVCR